jgi:hypothetical protein
MKKFRLTTFCMVLAAAALPSMSAFAVDDSQFELNAKFRAKIAKEKAKQASNRNDLMFGGLSDPGSQCGSLNIGNVDTGGRIGAMPREIFVFAPNAINLVSGQGCK